MPPTPEILQRSDGLCLIYPGKTHSFHGESESGKSWIVLVACVEQMQLGHAVLYLDYESDRNSILERLRLLGATDFEIAENFYYIENPETPAPAEMFTPFFLSRFRLVIVDGVTVCLSTYGLIGENNDDVAKWMSLLVNPLASRGAAVAVVDHVPKSKDQRGVYAIGAQSKRALTDVGYSVSVTKQLGRGVAGQVKVSVVKDRPGYVRGACEQKPMATAALFEFDSTDNARLRVTCDAPNLQSAVDEVTRLADELDLAGCPSEFGRDRTRRWMADNDIAAPGNDILTSVVARRKARATNPASAENLSGQLRTTQ